MGNSSSNPVKNLDKRTARREYNPTFARAIVGYRNQVQMWKDGASYAAATSARRLTSTDDGNNIKVCVRKRPIFPYELSSSEFDVITCCDSKVITVHDARMQNDMVRMYLDNHEFTFDHVFDEGAINSSVYTSTAAPLLVDCFGGGYATCMVYGQTGIHTVLLSITL
jgi:kinesin family protein 2/24